MVGTLGRSAVQVAPQRWKPLAHSVHPGPVVPTGQPLELLPDPDPLLEALLLLDELPLPELEPVPDPASVFASASTGEPES